ncbi:putative glycine-rich cell wall structural protein 1 protein [Neofusicoccum parvum UCRNP2]|uniref:Putative glycine-rich cell wall structural protein 1 protein n=1 Tax=Botryosphaeria parva (strain UCR-NP2) TaxID=1287680 RepID=R1H1H4_BOTPV|nr:putative glycine-rich cell wall structural protein 1 protein [Neofusicoccum parvum UCRNP2]
METISNIATSASKLIYGDPKAEQSGQEPVSGQTGRGTAEEPYDSGNLEGNPELGGKSAQETRTDTSVPTSSAASNPLSGGSAATTATSAAQGGAIRPEHQTEGTGVTSLHSNDPHGSDVRPSESNASSGSERILAGAGTTSAGGFSKAEPSVGADPSSAQKPVAKQQGGDKPTAVPTTGTETDAVKDKKDEGEAALAKRDPNDHSGEPLKVHDGSEKKEVHPGQDGGDTKSGEEQGTGEMHVKTTGFKADGGDFDASLPGLLEQKGVHKSGGAGGAADSSKNDSVSPARSAGSGEKTKTSMGTKIKEKLHIGSKHKSGSD